MTRIHRIGLIGAGGAGERHLLGMKALGRTELAGVVSGSIESASRIVGAWGGTAYADVGQMLGEARPDAAWVCVPPHASGPVCLLLAERGVPFMVEKPLAAADAGMPDRVAGVVRDPGLVVAVGYMWRALDVLPEMRRRFADRPPRLVVARWLGETPPPAWWRRRELGGGQVVEQATHQFDFARALLGEAAVVSAVAARHPRAAYPDADVDDVSAALLRFESGATGVFTSTCLASGMVADMTFVSEGLTTTIVLHGDWPFPAWTVTFDDAGEVSVLEARRDPFEAEDEAFLDAVEAGDPSRVIVTYEEALRTDRLTRAVVAAGVG